MVTNSELMCLVRDTSQRDDWRRQALEKLVANLAIEELYRLVRDTSVTNSWREYALDAICEMATWSTQSVSVSSLELCVGGNRVAINSAAVSLGVPAIAHRATDLLFEIINDTAQPTSWREQCLNDLIGIGHKHYLETIANGTWYPERWRDQAMQALLHR